VTTNYLWKLEDQRSEVKYSSHIKKMRNHHCGNINIRLISIFLFNVIGMVVSLTCTKLDVHPCLMERRTMWIRVSTNSEFCDKKPDSGDVPLIGNILITSDGKVCCLENGIIKDELTQIKKKKFLRKTKKSSSINQYQEQGCGVIKETNNNLRTLNLGLQDETSPLSMLPKDVMVNIVKQDTISIDVNIHTFIKNLKEEEGLSNLRRIVGMIKHGGLIATLNRYIIVGSEQYKIMIIKLMEDIVSHYSTELVNRWSDLFLSSI